MENEKKKDILLLIDANSLIHRAFHALPPLIAQDGRPSGALYGLASILIKVFNERSPKYVAAAFDRPEPTLRKKEYKEYKSTRPPTHKDLISQIQEAHSLLENFGVMVFEQPGWEADDIVAKLAYINANRENLKIVILSGDLDLLQAAQNNRVFIEVPKKGISETVLYNEKEIEERFGVFSSQLADYKGLVGDKSDNIPGVPGIGPKTASELIRKYKSIENIYKETDGIGMANKKLYETLINYYDQAILSKKLATLDLNVPISIKIEELEIKKLPNNERLIVYLKTLGFESLIKRIVGIWPSGYNTNE
jgi:DNA polymerase-1